MLLNVEIKNSPAEPGYDPSDSLVSQVLEELSELNHSDGTIISSFDLGTLEAVRRLDPTMATGLLIEVGAAGVGSVEVAAERGISAIHPFFFDTNAELVAAAREFGIEVNVWTVNARHDIEAMAALGLDAIITDDVTLARSVIDGD
jgi:glycerophosphoryl diester phosphodiesterase